MSPPPDLRWLQRFEHFRQALARLSAAQQLAAQRPLSELEQQGLIQAFEFTHELAWKTLKDFLVSRGSTKPLYGSKDATREAFAQGLLPRIEVWMDMITARNATSHTYSQKGADQIAAAILTEFVACFTALEAKLRTHENDPP
jgi:nucleotidyltransferase substrate binding protein (TIGR01987 family)